VRRAYRDTQREVIARRPRAALLVDFPDFNAPLGRWLKARGVHVVWCVAPQVWAWRAGRLRTLSRSLDRLAVLFAFEAPLWQAAGVEAVWVGHPAADRALATTADAARRAGLAGRGEAIALLPGSRVHELRATLGTMLAAVELLRGARPRKLEARVMIAPSLPAEVVRGALAMASRYGVETLRVDAAGGLAPLLPAFSASVVSAGTATLEAALAGASPVIVARPDALTMFAARRLVRTPHVGLPNVVLGERVFPELVGAACSPQAVAAALAVALGRGPDRVGAAGALRERLDPGDGKTTGERVAALLRPWI
jgi:lipid-A-disaccharide synthase